MTRQALADELRSFLLSEFIEVQHPFVLSDPSNTYRFGNIELVVEIFLRFLSHECDEERLQAVGTDFYAAFQQFNDARYTETDKRSMAVQALAVRFEAFLKKVTYYRYPGEEIWHHGLDTLLRGPVLSLQSNLKQRDVSYWQARPVRDAIIRDQYHLRHPSAHEAWKRSSAEVDRYARSVIAAYLFVVAENLEVLRKVVFPETARDLIAEYLESLTHDNRFRVWRSAYTSLTVSSRDSIDESLVPFDLVLSELIEGDDEVDEIAEGDEVAYREMEEERGPVEQIVGRYSHLVIVGDAGAGKSTILQRLALLYADDALSQIESGATDFIAPIYVELSTYRDSLLDLIRITLKVDSTQQLLNFLRDGRFVLLMDGLNEIASNRYWDAVNDIKRFMAEFSSNRYLITSRKEGYHNDLGVKTFEVNPLADEQIREYLTRYLGSRRGETIRHQLRTLSLNLGRNPLVLFMAVRVFSERGRIPENRANLFRQFVEWMYAREERKGQQTPRVLKEDVLIDLSYQMQLSGEVSIQETVARDIVAAVLENLHERTASPSGLLAELVDNGFLTRPMPDRVRYFHQLAQEYFAALAVRRLINQDSLQLETLLADRGWDEILVMLAGLAETSDSVVTALLREDRLRLAARCFSAGKNTSPHMESALFHRLEEGVNASDVDELLAAIAALGEIRTKRACTLLKRAVRNSVDLSAERRGKRLRLRRKLLRSQLAQAIDNYDFQTFEGLLNELITDSQDTKRAFLRFSFILFMICHLTHDDSGPFLLRMVQSPNGRLANCAAQAIGSSGREDLVPELIKLADSDDPGIRESLAICLSYLIRLSPSLVQETLVKLSQDSNPQVARPATVGLCFIPDIHEAVAQLLRASKSGHDTVQRSAASAMGNLDVNALEEKGLLNTVVGRLKEFLLGSCPKPTRRRAARSLGRIGTPLCISILQQAILDPRQQVQGAAVEGLSASVGKSRLNQRVIDGLATIIAFGQGTKKVRRSAARLLAQQRAYQVLPYLEEALDRAPDARAEQPIRYALGQLRRGQAADSKADLSMDLSGWNELSSSTPFEPHVFRQYARFLARQRRYREAKEVSELIVDRAGSPDDYRHYARLLSIVGKEADAERAFRTAMRLSPDNDTIKQDFVYFLIKGGRGGEACQILMPLASRADPDKVRVTLSFAAALDMLGRAEEAESKFWAAIQDWSGDPSVHNAFANYLKDHGRLSEAEQHYLAAINLAPDNGVFANNYGMLLMQKGDYEAAGAQFVKAIQLDSAFPWPYCHLATLYASQNRSDEVVKLAVRGIRCFLQYEDYGNSLHLARLAFDSKEQGVVEKGLLVEFGIVATSLALLSVAPESIIGQLFESAESMLGNESLRPLVGCLHSIIAEKLMQSAGVVISPPPLVAEFAQVQELVNRSTLWYAEMRNEILGIFSEQVDDWNLVVAGLIADLAIRRDQ